MQLDENKSIKDHALLVKSVVMICLVVLGFVFHSSLGVDSCVIALASATIMMLIGKQETEEVILGVEWSTILFFTGLFVVVGGMQQTGIITLLGNALVSATGGNAMLLMLLILWGSALFSSILDNIPFVATMIPLILAMQADGMDVTALWWALSLGACLGGNGTLIGASERGAVGHLGQARPSDHLCAVSQGRLPDDDPVGRDLHGLPADPFPLMCESARKKELIC